MPYREYTVLRTWVRDVYQRTLGSGADSDFWEMLPWVLLALVLLSYIVVGLWIG